MKSILKFLFTFLLFLNCKAQQIIDLYDNNTYGLLNNVYYKDITGFHEQYIGTWLYKSGNTSLKLIFQKREKLISTGRFTFYEDILVGEYQYIENGVEKVNTLANINTNYGNNSKDMEKHYLMGNSKTNFNKRYKCPECSPNEWRIELSLSEPNYNGMGVASNDFVMRRFFDNGVEKLKVWFVNTNQIEFANPDGTFRAPAPYKLPVGEYVLVKQ